MQFPPHTPCHQNRFCLVCRSESTDQEFGYCGNSPVIDNSNNIFLIFTFRFYTRHQSIRKSSWPCSDRWSHLEQPRCANTGTHWSWGERVQRRISRFSQQGLRISQPQFICLKNGSNWCGSQTADLPSPAPKTLFILGISLLWTHYRKWKETSQEDQSVKQMNVKFKR